MAHYSRLDKIVIDVAPDDHDAELAFWAGAIGPPLIQSERYPEYHSGEIPGQDIGILVQRLPTTWNTKPRHGASSVVHVTALTGQPRCRSPVGKNGSFVEPNEHDPATSMRSFHTVWECDDSCRGGRSRCRGSPGGQSASTEATTELRRRMESFGIALPPLMMQALAR